jgi:Domain of unknown function (DUF4389)
MHYDVVYTEQRNRLTTAFRVILAIPHLIVAGVWAYLAEIIAVVQWFIVLFTGKRNRGIWDLQWAWLGYDSRVNGYTNLLFDPYPAFGTDPGPVPVTTEFAYEEPADRLTNGLRFIWAIPALFVSLGLSIAAFFVLIVSWFAILFTGKHPRGQFDFLLRTLRYILQTTSYVLLMTDTYPSWSATSEPTGPYPGGGTPPPPPPPGQQPPPHPPTAPPGSAPPPPPA